MDARWPAQARSLFRIAECIPDEACCERSYSNSAAGRLHLDGSIKPRQERARWAEWNRVRGRNASAFAVLLALCVVPVNFALAKSRSPVLLAQTPPMGWNGWYKFGCNVDEKLLREIADVLVSSGMRDVGYRYVNVDDCWQVSRDAVGSIVVDPARFPSGMKALVDYVHRRGLKFGIYTDAGTLTCAGRPGSLGYEVQDAKTYASWGVDYLKIDWCHTSNLDPEVQYSKFRSALLQAGRPIVLSLCNWGGKAPWVWGSRIANLWRTTGDIEDNYERMSAIGFSQDGLEKFAGPGHWNDPDVLQIGNGGMTHDEYKTHMSLWALLTAPLLAGNDIRGMNKETTEILTNSEVIGVDQDKKGSQGYRLWEEGPREIWIKPLYGGSEAVGLFNRGESALKFVLALGDKGASARCRDLWAHKDLGLLHSYSVSVPRHGVVLLKVSNKPKTAKTLGLTVPLPLLGRAHEVVE